FAMIALVVLAALPVLSACTTFASKAGVTAAAAPAAPPPFKPRDLPVDTIGTTFGDGIGFTDQVVAGKTYLLVLSANGTAKRTAAGAPAAEQGSWRAADPGYCDKWGGAETCYTVHQTSPTTFDLVDKTGAITAHWTE